MALIRLKAQREKSLLRRHPWVFSGAISGTEGAPGPGETVDVLDSSGEWVARGAYSGNSQITVRVWTFDHEEMIGPAFFRNRLERAVRSRRRSAPEAVDSACRLVNAESDGLPGLVVDRYGEYLVCQFLTTGVEYWKEEIVALLEDLFPCVGVYERSDVAARDKEGLERKTGVLAGREPPEFVEIREGDFRFLVDVKGGHKTGFYLDQRVNRRLVMKWAHGATVLNCFSYTGGFAVAALKAGARSVVNVESGSAAQELARRNLDLNGLDTAMAEFVEGDVFTVLRRYRDAGRQFDCVILDPPKFADSRAHVDRACRGYKDINLLAFKLLRPDGILVTFSCSGIIARDLFQKVVADAALDAGRHADVLQWLNQAPDHPCALSFPEGSYLKGLVCHVW